MSNIILALVGTLLVLSLATGSAFLGKRYGVGYLIATMASLVVVSNIIAVKIVELGSLTVPAAVVVFPATFLVTDILAEKWGREQARRAVWAGFYASLVMVAAVVVAVRLEPAPFAQEFATSFDQVLGMAPRVVLASLVAYLVSQHHDVFAFEWWRRRTGGRFLALRNNASTAVSQLADTVLFITIAFAGTEGPSLVSLIVGQYIVKLAFAALDTPFIYLASYGLDRITTRLPAERDND